MNLAILCEASTEWPPISKEAVVPPRVPTCSFRPPTPTWRRAAGPSRLCGRAGRCDGAAARAEAIGLERSGATRGARDQKPAHSDLALGRADPPAHRPPRELDRVARNRFAFGLCDSQIERSD